MLTAFVTRDLKVRESRLRRPRVKLLLEHHFGQVVDDSSSNCVWVCLSTRLHGWQCCCASGEKYDQENGLVVVTSKAERSKTIGKVP